MPDLHSFRSTAIRALLLLAVLCTGLVLAQPGPRRTPSLATAADAGSSAAADERSLNDTHQQLVRLLRITPALAGAVISDPSLLSDQSYVARGNPVLAQFLELHPEVARNPDFYLFATVRGNDRATGLRLQIWPERTTEYHESAWEDAWRFIPLVVMAAGLFWLIRLFVYNSRWKRTLKVQTEMQNKLLDKFSGNQELIAYLGTEAGKRILQVAAMSPSSETAPQTGGMLVRIMTPLQSGAVLIPIGIGLWYLSETIPNQGGIRVVAIVALTLGIGLVAAAAVCWGIARRYGLLPHAAANVAHCQQEQR